MVRKTSASEIGQQTGDRRRSSGNISLPWMLTVPFILQVVTVVGLVGYLSYLNGQRSVEDLTNQLMDAVSKRVEQKLTSYLATPRLVARINSDALRRGDLDLNLGRSNPKTEQFLWQQMQLFNNLTWISLGTEAGDSMGVWRPGEGQNLQISISNRSTDYYGTYYATDGQGKRTVKLKVEKPAFDPRTRPWYKSAIAARQVIWTDIYPGFTPGTIFIASSQPLYDRTGKLMGVCGVDISLLEIQRFLADNPVSPSGQVFIIERSGLLVASSSQERPFRLASGQSPKRVNVLESQTPLIRSTAVSLDRQLGDFVNLQQPQKFYFNSDGQPRFVRVLPFSQKPGLDWVIAIVVPEADVMGQIHRNTQTTIWICLAALAAIIALNTAIGRWLAKPIRELSYASQQIAGGQFVDRVRLPRIRELFTLADSFNQMSQEIQQSRQQLEEYSRSLEQKVSDRTQALQEEIQRRSEVEAALQAANAKFQHLAYVDGLTQISNRRLFDERLLHEWSRMKREQLPLSLILCDVDYFKQYNDTYGHQVGDECLQDVAKAIALATRRPADLAARYGGEEFIALLPNTDLTGAIEVARAIQTHIKHLQRPHERSQVSQYVTASMGIASTIPTKATTPEQLLLEVDRALYQAKREGRDRIAIGLFSD